MSRIGRGRQTAAAVLPNPGDGGLAARWRALWRRSGAQPDRRKAAARPAAEPVPVRDWVAVGPAHPARLLGFDQALVTVVVALMALGVVMVYSASVAMPDNPRFARYAATHFLSRHVLSLGFAFVCGIVAVQLPINVWEKWARWMFAMVRRTATL